MTAYMRARNGQMALSTPLCGIGCSPFKNPEKSCTERCLYFYKYMLFQISQEDFKQRGKKGKCEFPASVDGTSYLGAEKPSFAFHVLLGAGS